jgi:hypothetical protein
MSRKDRPATFVATDHRLSQHPPNHRTATSAAARAGAHPGAFAYLIEGPGPRLDGFEHDTLADFVTQAGRFEVFDDRLLSSLSF